jgi:hypothetical protein
MVVLGVGCAHAPVRVEPPHADLAMLPPAAVEPMWPKSTFWAKLIAIRPQPTVMFDVPNPFALQPVKIPSWYSPTGADRWLITGQVDSALRIGIDSGLRTTSGSFCLP